jgi:hypothetical protein
MHSELQIVSQLLWPNRLDLARKSVPFAVANRRRTARPDEPICYADGTDLVREPDQDPDIATVKLA